MFQDIPVHIFHIHMVAGNTRMEVGMGKVHTHRRIDGKGWDPEKGE